VVELGAGCALPSLLATTLPAPHTPKLVVMTDYPSGVILGNLKKNIERNKHLVQPGCEVSWEGYEWGTSVDGVIRHLST